MNINDKFYDFINLYNLIIKLCAIKNKQYTIDLYYLNNNLYLQVKDIEDKQFIYNDTITCNEQEAEMIFNTVANEFILSHRITLASFRNLNQEEIFNYYRKNPNGDIINQTNVNEMIIHELANSIFTLRIHHYNGVDLQTKLIHQKALEKLQSDYAIENDKVLKK